MFHGLREDRAAHLASGHCAIDYNWYRIFRDGVSTREFETDRVAIDRCGQSHRGFDRHDLYVLKLNENTQAHKLAATNFGKFSRKIRLELALPLKDRTKDGAVMIDEARQEYDRLLEEAPDIPRLQLEAFEREFPGGALYKPEIIQIHPIRTYGAIRENAIMRALKGLVGESEEKKKLKKELEAIRAAGKGW